MLQKRRSLQAALSHGWLAGPLLFAALVSPPVAAASEKSLVVHHLAHWLMVAAGAFIGYQLRDAVRMTGPGVFAAAGLLAALTWHAPPLLWWAESRPATHAFAHATLVAGGAAMGWAVPKLSSAGRAYLFVGANVVMWPLVLAELAGAFAYAGYADQTAAAGVVELVAMSLSWLVILGWPALRRWCTSPAASVAIQAVFALTAVVGWSSRLLA